MPSCTCFTQAATSGCIAPFVALAMVTAAMHVISRTTGSGWLVVVVAFLLGLMALAGWLAARATDAAPIPEARRAALPGVRCCVACQEALDRAERDSAGYNRRGSKDSQLR